MTDAVVDPENNPEAYRPPMDFRPKAVKASSVCRTMTLIWGEPVTYSVVGAESDVLPEGVNVGRIYPTDEETGAQDELVVRELPRVDEGVGYMGDGQKVASDIQAVKKETEEIVYDETLEAVTQFLIQESIEAELN